MSAIFLLVFTLNPKNLPFYPSLTSFEIHI